MPESYTSTLANYAANLKYDDLPKHVIDHAKLLLVDGIGCGLFGSSLPWSSIAAGVVRSFDTVGKATIWGTTHKVSVPHAALVNGTAVHGFELDDLTDGLHSASVTLPPALALAEQKGGISGKELLTSVVAGIEVGRRVSACMGLEIQRKGFHHPSVHGVFAAGAAAGRVLGLNHARMIDCFSHAGAMAGGLMVVQYGGMMKRMLCGRSSQTGVYAAVLAQGGFDGAREIFEPEYGGFCTSFSMPDKKYDMTKLTEDLGRKYYTMEAKFKTFSCRGPIQTSLSAIKQLREQGHELNPAAIDHVKVSVPRWIKEVVGWDYVPRDVTSAQLNLSYGIAVMLLEREAFVDQYTPEKIKSPVVLDLISRIKVIHDPALDAPEAGRRAVILEFFLKNGKKVDIRLKNPTLGNEADVLAKFKKLVNKVADEALADRIIQQVRGIDGMADATELAETLCFPGRQVEAFE